MKVDVDSFFNGIGWDLIRTCFHWLWERWKEKFGGRRNYLVLPRSKGPFDRSIIRTSNVMVNWRVKQEIVKDTTSYQDLKQPDRSAAKVHGNTNIGSDGSHRFRFEFCFLPN